MIDEESKKMEQLINYFNTVSPHVLLNDLTKGSFTDEELSVVVDVMDSGLSNGVVNTLLNCVFLMNGEISRPYAMKIASHWLKLKVTTVEQAMELAKKERKQYELWVKNDRKATDKLYDFIKLDDIYRALNAGLNDEELGKYVRKVLSKSTKH